MTLRSLLFVPGDRGDRMEKALASGADALILDLEDAVLPAAKAAARETTAAFLQRPDRPVPLFVRVNPLGSGMTHDDVTAVLNARPDALVLPKAEGAASVEALAAMAPGVPTLPIATETPAAIFQLGSYAQVAGQLAGLTWGAEDLPAAIGAASAREADGRYTAPYELARSLTLFGAHAAGVPAIETVYPAFRDLDGLERYVARAARDGFTAMLAGAAAAASGSMRPTGIAARPMPSCRPIFRRVRSRAGARSRAVPSPTTRSPTVARSASRHADRGWPARSDRRRGSSGSCRRASAASR